MSRFTTVFLIAVIASSSLIAESGQDQAPPAIQGEVLDAGTQRPLSLIHIPSPRDGLLSRMPSSA